MSLPPSGTAAVLSVYRSILRTARSLPSYNHRGLVLQQARAAFRSNANLKDEEEVAFAIALADTQLENLQAQVTHMNSIMKETNTLTHNAPKPDKMWINNNAKQIGNQRRSLHTAAIRRAEAAPAASSIPTPPLTPPPSVASPFASTPSLFTPQQTAAPLVATHIVHVLLSPNNTICTLTTLDGDTKAWSSSGTCGFKNSKKSTYMACIACGEQLGQKARNQNIRNVDMHISGFHRNKKAVLKGLMKAGLNIVSMHDTTPIPFNGCKPKKQRRI